MRDEAQPEDPLVPAVQAQVPHVGVELGPIDQHGRREQCDRGGDLVAIAVEGLLRRRRDLGRIGLGGGAIVGLVPLEPGERARGDPHRPDDEDGDGGDLPELHRPASRSSWPSPTPSSRRAVHAAARVRPATRPLPCGYRPSGASGGRDFGPEIRRFLSGPVASPAMAIYALGDMEPTIDPDAYVHPDAVVIGDVTLGPETTVWPSAVLRGDYGAIVVGARTSIQDGTVIHAGPGFPDHGGQRLRGGTPGPPRGMHARGRMPGGVRCRGAPPRPDRLGRHRGGGRRRPRAAWRSPRAPWPWGCPPS